MVMTRPPAYHPGNFLMKNMNPTNSGLIIPLLCMIQLSYDKLIWLNNKHFLLNNQ